MRAITSEAIDAFNNKENFKKSNTEVEAHDNVTVLKLHGHEIAYRYNFGKKALRITNAGWATPTTKERLNGLDGVSIYQKKGVWYLNDEVWDGNWIEVK